jgi:predicted branched-subunit amino acid permease
MSFFWRGLRDEFLLLVGVFPLGMIYGALPLAAGIPAGQTQAMSSIVFACSSQMVTTQLVHTAMSGIAVVVTILVINLRHALSSLAPCIKQLPTHWKLLLSYLLTDEAYAVTVTEYERNGVQPHSHWIRHDTSCRSQPPCLGIPEGLSPRGGSRK